MLDALVFEDLRDRDRQREGREREIVALEPQRRQAEQEADDEADQRRPPGSSTQYGKSQLSIMIAAV